MRNCTTTYTYMICNKLISEFISKKESAIMYGNWKSHGNERVNFRRPAGVFKRIHI